MSHLEHFKSFINSVNDFNYVILRGYHELPTPKGKFDLDISFCPEDYNKIIDIAKMLEPGEEEDYGYAEWCDMKYFPHFTTSNDKGIRFRLDLYNSIFFLSPANNYTTNWTIPKDYFESIMENKRINDFYNVPSYQDEIVLTIMRAVLDRRGWKDKYRNLCSNLLTKVDKDLVIQSLKLATLPDPDHIYYCLNTNKYTEIVTWE